MTRDDDRTGITPFDVYPPFTPAERIEVERLTDPRRDWPTREEVENDTERRPACCQMTTCVRCEECDHDEP